MDENIADKLPPEGTDSPSETVVDTAQSGLVPIIEVSPDDADSSSSSSRRRQTTSPDSRIRLVADIERFLGEYVVFENPDCSLPVALWILGTHTWMTRGVPCPFRAYPYLQISSRFKGSGKSTFLELLRMVCRDPEIFTDPTGAAIFRIIGDRRPTLLCDQQEQLRADAKTTSQIG